MDKKQLATDNILIPNNIDIKSMICTIRGQQVMLDSDLANIYGYSVKDLNRQVKNNINKFPMDFMFQLTREELDFMRCKNCTSPNSTLFKGQEGGRRYLPYVFTEQGIYMLATVLKGELATKQTIYIIRSFKEMRHMYYENKTLLNRVSKIESAIKSHDNKLNEISKYMIEHNEVKQKLFFKGQIYDAFSLFTKIISKAKNEIVLIDNYVDIKTLNILAKKNKEIIVYIYTSNKGNRLTNIDINNFNKEYPTLTLKIIKDCHDRFLIIDDKHFYNIGASIKDAGNKSFYIGEIEDISVKLAIKNLIK